MAREKVFKTSRLKLFLVALISLAFVICGTYMIESEKYQLMGWVAIVFFGVAGAVGLYVFVSGGVSLRLDEEGFDLVGLLASTRYRWTDIEPLSVFEWKGTTQIGIRFRDPENRSATTRSLTGGMDGLVTNIYGVGLEELCQTLNEWRNRYGPESGGSAYRRSMGRA